MQPVTQKDVYSLDARQVLEKAEINPDSLADPLQRTSIENHIINKEFISIDDRAILQLLSQAETDSDTYNVDQKRQAVLRKRIQEGPLRSSTTLD